MPAPSVTKLTTLFSLATVKAYLTAAQAGALGPGDTSWDVLLIQIADGVSEKIESTTRRIFVTRDRSEVYDGEGTRQLRLRVFPVSAVASLTVKDSADQVTPTPLVEGTDYDRDGRLGILALRHRRFTRGFQNVAITYTAGWGAQDDESALPADIFEAGLEWTKAIFDEKRTGATSASSVNIGPASIVLKPGLGFNIKQTLDAWRAVRL